MAKVLDRPFSNAIVKNRYVYRTFILPGQQARKQGIRRKLSPIACEFKGKSVCLVDDSIVRGATSREIVSCPLVAPFPPSPRVSDEGTEL